MPTVMRIGPWRVVIYFNDHSPRHVHVISAGGEAIFELGDAGSRCRLRESSGVSRAQLVRIAEAINANLPGLREEWERLHDDN